MVLKKSEQIELATAKQPTLLKSDLVNIHILEYKRQIDF